MAAASAACARGQLCSRVHNFLRLLESLALGVSLVKYDRYKSLCCNAAFGLFIYYSVRSVKKRMFGIAHSAVYEYLRSS
jgi:hypothetical protein